MKGAALLLLTLNVSAPERPDPAWLARRERVAERAAAARPDAAAYQELPRREDAEALASAAGHGAVIHHAPTGLALTTRLPVLATAALDLGGGFGALAARVSAPAGPFVLLSARAEPGEGLSAARRAGQLAAIAEFARERSSSSPFVLLGDLGAAPEDPEPRLLLDLLGGRDLCVRHGDEVCGRTREDSRVDFAIVPYSSGEPGSASTAFTELSGPPEQAVPLPPRFGLEVRLLPAASRLRSAASPEGRTEALDAVIERLAAALERVPARRRAAAWLPWRGALDVAAIDAEAERLEALRQRALSARIRAARAN